MDNSEEFRCISLCSGYAGIELGLKRVIPNLRTVAYVEVEAFACTNLVAKIEEGKLDAAPIWTDIKTFDGRPFRDRIHLITGGYPCQPFSVAGQRRGTDDPRHLWPYIERIIQAVRPVWCFFENVSGHLTIGYPEVYRSLRLMGYSVEAGLFTAEEIGTPHKRERLFILANSRNRGFCRPKILSQQQGRAQTISTSKNRWPARPGQPQYEWEEPRVVANAKQQRPIQSKSTSRHRQELSQDGGIARQENNTTKGQTQSRLGRTTDGTSSRMDRLRLLGNGCVPQTVELAWRILWQKHAINAEK